MRSLSVSLCIFILITNYGFAQKKTYLGFETGYKADIYSYFDPGALLNTSPTHNQIFSLIIGQELNNNLILESGFINTNYDEVIRFSEYEIRTNNGNFTSLQIPIRIKYRVWNYKERFSITPFLGYTLASNQNYSPSGNEQYAATGTIIEYPSSYGTASLYSVENSNYSRLFSLVEAGSSLNYSTKRGFTWSLTGRYVQGTSKILERNIYSINDQETLLAQSVSRGSNYQFLLGLNYSISTIWQNREARRERRPERLEDIKTSRNVLFYIGIEAKSIRYHSIHTNSNIIGKMYNQPNTNMGIGINFGYRFYDRWYLESGIHTQNFWSAYTIHHDEGWYSNFIYHSGPTKIYTVPLYLMYN